MKKLTSLLLALVMVFSLATVVLAVDDQASTPSTNPADLTFTKNYVTSDKELTDVVPTEDLTFVITADDSNPAGAPNLYIGSTVSVDGKYTVSVNGSNEVDFTVVIPEYTAVGTYVYTISEETPASGKGTQGVTYSNDVYEITVYVTWADDDHTALESNVIVKKNGVKITDGTLDFNNTYELGTLSVEKFVTGNLGDKTKEFEVTVTFSSENDPRRAISYNEDTGKTITLEKDSVSGKYTASVTLNLHDLETVTFSDIPAGVTYSVSESLTYSEDTNKNGVNGYDAPKYEFNSNEVTEVSGKVIAEGSTDKVDITNNKGIDIPSTGVSLDTLPFVLILAICAGVAVLFVVKRRRSNEF